MRATYQRELDGLESHLAFLASTGSVSPYVWSIRYGVGHHARLPRFVVDGDRNAGGSRAGYCRGLGGHGHWPLRSNPAVVAYNRFAHDVDRISVRFESFMEEFSNILQRQMKVMPRHNRRLMNEINVVPYIDVMLVLLVIFMVTAPMIQPGSVDLPSVGKSSQPPVAPLEITVKADGTLTLRDRAGNASEDELSKADLAQRVRAAQKKNPEQAVLIAGDRNVKYDAVLGVMDELQRQQVAKIGLLVQPGKQ